MQLLLRNCTIVHPDSRYHGKKVNLFIKDGIIEAIGARADAPPRARVIDLQGACVSPGWIDVGTQVGDPGFEHREDITTASAAAAAGGYTAIACQPNTQPVIHSKSEVLYLKRSTRDSLVDFFPIGAVSQNCEGGDITEMYDMQQHGAVAFSDGQNSIQNNGLMQRALQYVKAFDGLIINHPHDKSLAPGGLVHEGLVSTSMGLKGIPSLAEDLMVQRDIYLAEYTDSRLHIANISSRRAVELVRQAKAKGLKVTASVAALNLVYQDTALQNFDVHFKVLPPLRESDDTKALLKGIKDGTIDFISSNHVPIEWENKDREFFYSEPGAIMLGTTYALLNTALADKISSEQLVKLLSIRPRQILDLPVPAIKEGASANLT
ncbi:MAG: dihydroorotase, partial [Bacteroidota bacterium]